jgi:uncharacterized protein DUF4169
LAAQGRDGLTPLYPATAEYFMGDVIKLRAARKRAKRRDAEQKAAANRVAHGRTKAERTQTQSRNDKARRSLDLHRVETGDRQ